MAINKTASNSKGRNAMPMSSILDYDTRDFDVSGLAVSPEDGEFLVCAASPTGVATRTGPTFAAHEPNQGAMLRMVWSENSRSDLTASGRKRVPVLWRKSAHFKVQLYNYDSAALPNSGQLLTVAVAQEAVNGDSGTTRLVLEPVVTGSALTFWCVGHVVADVAKAGDPMEVYLYDAPRLTAI